MEYNALIRQYSGKSLKVLARVLVADLKDFPADWKIRYRCKEIDKTSTSIDDLCCCSKNLLQIYKPAENLFPVRVRTVDGKSFDVTVSPTDTVMVLKLKIFQLETAYPPMVQELYVNRKNAVAFLSDWVTLDVYRVSSGGTIYLKQNASAVKELQMGVKFKAIDLDSTYERRKGQYQSPAWARFSAGTNFSGLCPSPNCASKELAGVTREIVVRDLPYGEIRLNVTREKYPLNCPTCSQTDVEASPAIVDNLVDIGDDVREETRSSFHIALKCIILFDARSLLFLKRRESTRVRAGYYESKPKEGTVYTRVEVGENIECLEITTVEPWRSPFCCVKCDTKIEFKSHEIVLRCGHAYHTWCAPSLLKPKGRKCKVCHAKVLIMGKIGDALKTLSE